MHARLSLLWLMGAAHTLSRVWGQCPSTAGFVIYAPDYTDCNRYYICAFGISHHVACGNGTVWQQNLKVCALKGSYLDKCSGSGSGVVLETTVSPENPSYGSEVCNSGTAQIFPHATNCARYYNCSQPTQLQELSEVHERECVYPLLFNQILGSCDMPTNVFCEGKYIPTNPCDYAMNLCVRSHCVPCNVRYPDCKGQDNGYQPWKGREGSPDFVICDNGRVLSNGTCPKFFETQYLFHPTWKGCVEPRLLQ